MGFIVDDILVFPIDEVVVHEYRPLKKGLSPSGSVLQGNDSP